MKLGIGALLLIEVATLATAPTYSQAQDVPPSAYPSPLQQTDEPDGSPDPAGSDAQLASQQTGSAGAQPVVPMAKRVDPSVNDQTVGDAEKQ